MSIETEQALRDAIIAHAHETARPDEDAYLCDWIVCAQWVLAADEDNDAFTRITPKGQSYHRSLGLLHSSIEDYVYGNLKARDGE